MESLLTTTEDIDQIALNYINKDRPNSNIINQNLTVNLVGFLILQKIAMQFQHLLKISNKKVAYVLKKSYICTILINTQEAYLINKF